MLAGTRTVIGTLELQVQDFVPNRLAVEVTPRHTLVTPRTPAVIDVASRYLYGAPAAHLDVSAHVQLQRDTAPIAETGWVFGRADEALNIDAQDIARSQHGRAGPRGRHDRRGRAENPDDERAAPGGRGRGRGRARRACHGKPHGC